MSRAVLQRQAAEALGRELQPGEHVEAGSAVTSDPSPWAAAAVLTLSVALTAAGLVGLLGSLQADGTPRRSASAAPLADLRVLNYRSGNYGASIRCQFPGRKPVLLHAGRAGRKDFAEVVKALARSGAFAKLDPPYPSAENHYPLRAANAAQAIPCARPEPGDQ